MSIISGQTKFSIATFQWKSASYKHQTFLSNPDAYFYGISAGKSKSLSTDNQVTVLNPGDKLNDKYLFIAEKCSNSTDAIRYNERVNIKSASNNFYIKCGGGTCSLNGPKNCSTGAWESFKFVKYLDTRNTGFINMGDHIVIQHFDADDCRITPADNGNTFCQTGAANSGIKLFNSNGTMPGVGYRESQDAYIKANDMFPTFNDWERGACEPGGRGLRNWTLRVEPRAGMSDQEAGVYVRNNNQDKIRQKYTGKPGENLVIDGKIIKAISSDDPSCKVGWWENSDWDDGRCVY